MTIALIDGDEVAYMGAFSSSIKSYVIKDDDVVITKGKTKQECIENLGNNSNENLKIETVQSITSLRKGYKKIDSIISKICRNTSCSDYLIYLNGDNNFRKTLATILPYKGGRKEKPISLPHMISYIKSLNCIIYDHLESDDCLSAQSSLSDKGECIICTQDKDLDTVPSLRYNPVKDKLYEISEQDARYNFYTQLIIGDKTDNIPSAYGCGKVYAAKTLEECYNNDSSEYEYYITAREAILNKLQLGKTQWWKDDMNIDEVLLEIGNLLYMHRTFDKEERWHIPEKKNEKD